jgi:hypothetical protein
MFCVVLVLWSDERAFYACAYIIYVYMYNRALCKHMYVYAPAQEAAAPAVFMVWLRACPYAIVLRTTTGRAFVS